MELSLVAGPLFLAATFALTLLRIEPFATFFYLCAWYGLIFTFDQFIRKREGRSLIARCGPGFLLVLFWSAVAWYFFELLNLRLQNWYYVFVSDRPVLRPIGTFLSFATVFPGIFWIDHYLALRGVGAAIRGKPLRFSGRGRRALQGMGVLFLVLPLLFPAGFFPLVWGALFLLLAPLEYRRGGGLLRQLEEGNYGPLVRTLLAGLIAGFFWESLNFEARAKWIYTVPFFDRLKLFEMPLAGFLGFPPFAVECAVLYRFLVWHHLAPPFGAFGERQPEPGGRTARAGVVLFGLVFALAVDGGVVGPVTITSVTPRVELAAGLDPETKAVLAGRGVRYLTDLEGWGAKAIWRDLEGRLSAGQLAGLRRIARLYLHQGIGVEYGNLLVGAGIGSLEELGRLSAAEVRARLVRTAPAARLPTQAQLQVWIRRAPMK
jgi:hypothetical protein